MVVWEIDWYHKHRITGRAFEAELKQRQDHHLLPVESDESPSDGRFIRFGCQATRKTSAWSPFCRLRFNGFVWDSDKKFRQTMQGHFQHIDVMLCVTTPHERVGYYNIHIFPVLHPRDDSQQWKINLLVGYALFPGRPIKLDLHSSAKIAI